MFSIEVLDVTSNIIKQTDRNPMRTPCILVCILMELFASST